MTKQLLKWTLCSLVLCSAAFAADAFPRVTGQTFGERAVIVPDAFKGKPTILVITFTRSAQEQARSWADKLKQKALGLETHQVLELEDVPRLMRGFVRGSIRRSIPKESQDNFVLLFEGEEALKKSVNYQASDDAYVVMLDSSGNIVWREHGAVDDKKFAALAKQVSGK